MSSTNAGVTEAPPLETSRTDETSSPGPSARARAIAMKKVGGPARNEILSRATRDSACSGSKRRTRTDRRPAAPGTRTPLRSPEMCAIGAGMSTASAGPRLCTPAISEAFQLSPRWVCSTALGTPVEPEVNRTSATSAGLLGQEPVPTGAPPRASARAPGSEMASGARSTTSAGSICPRTPATSADPKEWRTGAATAPMRQQARVSTAAARLFGTCQATASPCVTRRSLSPPATVATSASAWEAESRVSPSTTSPPWAEISASSVGTSQGPPGRR
ncbi:MAG: hypothetical protein ABSG39_08755 [Acidimicrobiales bacterium]